MMHVTRGTWTIKSWESQVTTGHAASVMVIKNYMYSSQRVLINRDPDLPYLDNPGYSVMPYKAGLVTASHYVHVAVPICFTH